VTTAACSSKGTSAKVVVLDRDGTIVIDRDYLDDPDELEFLAGAAEGLRRLHQRGHRLVVISNQSGVGRGLFTSERLEQINARFLQMVRAAGAELAGIYCCPHRPEEGCACRKPGTQLLVQAARELGFDPSHSIVIGDKSSDIELGRRVDAVTVLISSDSELAAQVDPAPHYVAADLTAAARLVERLESGAASSRHTHCIG
jgi:D-glycero-D-manno-heptose 1,7-bisphosphate phosphatase